MQRKTILTNAFGLLLGSGCGLFGLNGDTTISLFNLACSGGVPNYPLLTIGTQTGYLEQGRESVTHCLDSVDRGIDSAELVYTFSPPSNGRYEFSVYSDFDAVLYRVAAPCTEDPLVFDCTDGPGAGGTELFSADLFAGETTLIVVDGYTPDAVGNFTITVNQLSTGNSMPCGWDANDGFYECGFNGAADPSGTHPYACPAGVVDGGPCMGVEVQGCCSATGDIFWCNASSATLNHVPCEGCLPSGSGCSDHSQCCSGNCPSGEGVCR